MDVELTSSCARDHSVNYTWRTPCATSPAWNDERGKVTQLLATVVLWSLQGFSAGRHVAILSVPAANHPATRCRSYPWLIPARDLRIRINPNKNCVEEKPVNVQPGEQGHASAHVRAAHT